MGLVNRVRYNTDSKPSSAEDQQYAVTSQLSQYRTSLVPSQKEIEV